MSVRANVTGNDPQTGEPVLAQQKVDELKAWVENQEWPESIQFTFAGANEQTQETNQFMMQAGLGALFLMFLILLTQFNSFYQVFITLSTVIMSTAGVLLGMLITGQPFSAIMTGIGIVSLAGVVVNNSIVLIDTFNRLRKDNIDPVAAVLMTAAQRTRPVILTTVTTIFGLLPMALGISINFFGRTIELGAPSGAWWTSLSTALVSGLAFSSLLTLFLVPVLLTAPGIWKGQIAEMWNWFKGLFFRGKPVASALATPAHASAAPTPATAIQVENLAPPEKPALEPQKTSAGKTRKTQTKNKPETSKQAAE